MLTAEENEMLTRVGPGTPAGELLRRYWHPVAIAADLTPDSPTKFVRILSEDLVLFQTTKGEVGLLHDRCSHRGASLSYGRVEERGIACAYHGWLYDTKGNCLETPAEPAESNFCRTVKHKAYPVQKLAGLYWAYLGPEPAPVIPKYDVWARTDGWHWLRALPQLDCNWLQAMENSVDTAHLHILHQELVTDGFKVESTTRGTIDNLEKVRGRRICSRYSQAARFQGWESGGASAVISDRLAASQSHADSRAHRRHPYLDRLRPLRAGLGGAACEQRRRADQLP